MADPNPFDAFDALAAGANPFDAFDPPSQTPTSDYLFGKGAPKPTGILPLDMLREYPYQLEEGVRSGAEMFEHGRRAATLKEDPTGVVGMVAGAANVASAPVSALFGPISRPVNELISKPLERATDTSELENRILGGHHAPDGIPAELTTTAILSLPLLHGKAAMPREDFYGPHGEPGATPPGGGGEPPAAPSPHLRLTSAAPEEITPERVQPPAPRAPLPDVRELTPRAANPFDAFDLGQAEELPPEKPVPAPPRAATPVTNPFDAFETETPGRKAANPAKVETPEDLAAATAHVTQPTPAQAEAGNYSKAHVEVSGFPLTIETPKGGVRSGADASGKPWSVTMPVAYGEVRGAKGFDGDKLDVFVGDNPQAKTVYLLDQVHAGTDKFDEAKALMGFNSASEARAAYEGSFSDDRGHERVGGMVPMSLDEFRDFVDKSKNRAMKSPAAVIARRREAAMPKPVKPMRLATWLKAQGGIKEYAGELRHMGAHKRPGLVNNRGMHPDEAARAAAEAGYLEPKFDENGDIERPDMNRLFEALYDDLGNNPVYPMAQVRRGEARPEDTEVVNRLMAAVDDAPTHQKIIAEIAAMPADRAIAIAKEYAVSTERTKKAAIDVIRRERIRQLRNRNEMAAVERASKNINDFIGGSSGAPLTKKDLQGAMRRESAPGQTTLPGTEPISDKELAERKMQGRKGTEKAQKDTGELPLFDTNAQKQKSLFKTENALPADTSNLRATPLTGRQMAKYRGVISAMHAISRRLNPRAELHAVSDLHFLDAEGKPVAVADAVALGRTIQVALEGNRSPVGSVGHEHVHVMRTMGLFKDDEWGALEREATRRGWHARHSVDDHYPHADEELKTEEAIAEEFPHGWLNSWADYPPLIRKLFMRMRSFLTQLGAAVRRIFGGKPTAAEVFDLMERGAIGRRADHMRPEEMQSPRAHVRSEDEELARRPRPERGPFADVSVSDMGAKIGEDVNPNWEDWEFKTLTDFEARRLRRLPEQEKIKQLTGAMAAAAKRGFHVELLPDDMRVSHWDGKAFVPAGGSHADVMERLQALAIDAKGNRTMPVKDFNHKFNEIWDRPSNTDIRAAMRREPPPPPEPPEGALPEDSDLLRPLRGSSLERDIAEGRPLPEAAYQPLKGARVLNQVSAAFIRPLVLADQDFRSSHYWEAKKKRDDMMSTLRHDYARRLKGYTDLDPKDLKPVHAALELARLNGLDLAEEAAAAPRGLLVLHNSTNQEAQLSRPGDTVRLTPAQNKVVLEELVPTFKKVWDDVVAGVARKYGYDGDTSPEGIARAIEVSDPGTANRKSLERIQGLLNAVRFASRVGYVPFKRFGDYFITASPKIGTDMESLGGFPERSWFQLVDTSKERVNQLGGWRNPGEVPKSAQAAIAAVQDRFPAETFDVRHGYFENKATQIRALDIPAIEKLLMLLDVDEGTEDLVEKIRDQFYSELTAGFRREARNTPGYDPDFRHAIGAYLNGVASHVSNLVHGEGVDRAKKMYIDNHPSDSIRKFWKDYDDAESGKRYQGLMNPIMREVRQVGFLYTMAGNVFSMAKMLLHGPQMGGFLMMPGHPLAPLARIFSAVAKDIIPAIRFDAEKGLHVNLRAVTFGRPLDERRAVNAARDMGLFHSDIEDFMRGSMQTTEQRIAQRDNLWQRANRILGSNIGVMDQTVRLSEFLAAYRLAKQPERAQRIIDYWSGKSETFNRAMSGGFTPEKFARWFVDEMVGSFDPKDRPQFMRGQAGATFAQFHTFVFNLLANQWRFLRTMGPEGKLAVAQMIGALVLLTGIQGIPGIQDLESLIEKALQAAGYKNFNIEDQLRAMLGQSPVGKAGADAILHGLPRMVNEDWSSLGLGDEFSKLGGNGSIWNLFGTPSVIAQRVQGATERWYHGQPLGAIDEALPAFARNPMRGLVVDPNEGIQTRKGKMLVKPQDILPSTMASEALGIPSAQRAQAYQKQGENYRAGWPTGDPMADMVRGINARTRKAFYEQYGSIQDQIKSGDIAGARTRMRALGANPGLIKYVIRTTQRPELLGRGRAYNRAQQMATPEEKARMQQLRNQPPPAQAANPFDAFDQPAQQ